MKKKGFLKGAGILALATFFAKIIGAFYRIPLTNILGAEGMGVYQLIFPVYSFLLSTSSGALPVAISIIISEKVTKGEHNEAKTLLNSAMSVLLMTGIAISLGLILLSGLIANLQGNAAARLGYIAIAPSVFFVSGIAVLRGWFQGNGYMSPSALSQITEAFFKLAAGLTLAYILLPKGIGLAVFGAMAGVTVSEGVSFLTMYIIFRKKNEPFKLSFNWRESRAQYKEIIKRSIPMTIGGMILPFAQIIDSLIVVNMLSRTGSAASATSSYGLFTGYVSTLINLPIVLGLSLGIAVIPQLSKGKAQRDINDIKQKSDTSLKLSLMIGVPFALLYLFMPKGILTFLYPSLLGAELAEAARLLQIGAFSVIALSATQIYTSIMQGLGKPYSPVKNLAVGAAIKIALNLILLPYLGITGVAVASLVCFTATAALNFISMTRLTGQSRHLYKNSGVILLCGVIMSGVVLLINYLAAGRIAVIIASLVGAVAYFLLLIILKAFTENELLSLPFGGKLSALQRAIRIKG